MQDGASGHSSQPSCSVWGMFADWIKGTSRENALLVPPRAAEWLHKAWGKLWEVEAQRASGCLGSHSTFGGNSWVHLGLLLAGGIHLLQFHLLLATVQGSLKHKSCWERGGWESPRCDNHGRTFLRNSGIWLWKLWQGQVLAWGAECMVRVIFLLLGGFGETEAPEHTGRMCGLILIASKAGIAPSSAWMRTSITLWKTMSFIPVSENETGWIWNYQECLNHSKMEYRTKFSFSLKIYSCSIDAVRFLFCFVFYLDNWDILYFFV